MSFLCRTNPIMFMKIFLYTDYFLRKILREKFGNFIQENNNVFSFNGLFIFTLLKWSFDSFKGMHWNHFWAHFSINMLSCNTNDRHLNIKYFLFKLWKTPFNTARKALCGNWRVQNVKLKKIILPVKNYLFHVFNLDKSDLCCWCLNKNCVL